MDGIWMVDRLRQGAGRVACAAGGSLFELQKKRLIFLKRLSCAGSSTLERAAPAADRERPGRPGAPRLPGRPSLTTSFRRHCVKDVAPAAVSTDFSLLVGSKTSLGAATAPVATPAATLIAPLVKRAERFHQAPPGVGERLALRQPLADRADHLRRWRICRGS